MAWDLALMLPMLEMSGKHAVFIRDVLYLYNRSNPLNDHKVNVKLQSNCAEYARRITQYPRLKQLDINKEPESEQQTDLLIFSENNPRQLRALLESVERYASHLDKIFVVYSEEDAFAGIREAFPQVRFISYSDQPNEEFRMLVLKTISSASSSDYIVCATSEMILTEHVDFNACIQALDKTGAYGFYLSYGSKPIPYHLPIQNSKENLVDAWQFQIGFNEWKCAHTLKMALYSKNVVKKSLWALPFHDLTSLQERWAARGRPHKIGLFYTHPKAVSQAELESAF